VTLKIRVRTISYANVESVTTNRPAYVNGRARRRAETEDTPLSPSAVTVGFPPDSPPAARPISPNCSQQVTEQLLADV
jgi:hypothetical protein